MPQPPDPTHINRSPRRHNEQPETAAPHRARNRDCFAAVLSTAQQFMRERLRDECSFVSLRDVERSLRVLLWFLDHRDPLFRLMDAKSRDSKTKTTRR